MEKFKADLEELVNDWDVWSIISCDADKHEAVIQRSDEDQASVTISVPSGYPRGEIKLTHVFGHVSKQNNATVGDALDTAMEEWAELEGEDEGGMMERYGTDVDMGAYGAGGGDQLTSALEEYIDEKELQAAKDQIKADLSHPEIKTYGYYYDAARKQHNIRLGLKFAKLMDPFRARALGVNHDYTLVVDLAWDWGYMQKTDVPKVTNIYQIPDAQIKQEAPLEIQVENHVGALKWYLNNRISSALRKNHIVRERRLAGIVEQEGVYVEGLSNWSWHGDYENFERCNWNYLVGITRLMEYRVRHCTGVCIICDEKLPLDGMKTAICDRDMCRFGMENYGLGTDVVAELNKSQEVAELMIYVCCAGSQNGKSRDTFTPMCPIMIDENTAGAGYKGACHFYNGTYGTGSKNFDLLSSVSRKIPGHSDLLSMAQGRNDILRAELNKKDPLMFPLLQWIFSSNRTHLEPIPTENHFKGVGKHQFHLISSSPEREQKFREKRATAAKAGKGRDGRGSFWAWHGSQPGNWHCILRSGLKNYSNTKFMSAGAAYGAGIYTAKNISTSLHYMGSPMGPWPNASKLKHSSGCTLIALCEIADDKDGYKDHGNNIVTIQDEDIICTRFLFVFPDGFNGDNGLHTDSMAFPKTFLGSIDK